jgi:hypothetical protein
MAERKTKSKLSSDTGEFDELRALIVIDRDNLDQNAIDQPDLYFRVSEQATFAVSRRDEFEFKLQQQIAEVDKAVRKRYAKSDDKKPAETAIKTEIERDPSVMEMREEFLGLAREVARWNALRSSFDQRRDMLKVTAQLYASNYFTRSGVEGVRDKVITHDADEARRKAGADRRSRMRDDD